MIVTCPKCRRNVFPKADQSCPSCSGSLAGVPAAPEPTERERELARVNEIYQAERVHRRSLAEKAHARGVALVISGILILLIAGLLTFLSYSAAEPGGSYRISFGGLVGGLIMIGRGWSYFQDARRIRD